MLGRFMPEFGQVVVDDAVQHVPSLHRGRAPDPHRRRAVRHRARRLGRRAAPAVDRDLSRRSRTAASLYVAAFLHDIAKGRMEDHSIVGRAHRAQAVPALRPDAGRDGDRRLAHRASSDDEQHRAFSRDISDPKTIRDFADIVQSPERLKLLLVLTVRRYSGRRARRLERLEGAAAARRSTSRPSRWSRAGTRSSPRATASPRPRTRFRAAVADWPRRGGRALHRPALSRLLAADRHAQGRSSTHSWCAAAERAGREASPAPSHRRLYRHHRAHRCSRPTIRACWRCLPAPAPPRAPISSARTSPPPATASRSTRSCSRASSTDDEDELRRAPPHRRDHREAAEGRGAARRADGQAALDRRGRLERLHRAARSAVVDNALSDQFTVIEVAGLDRPGLLYRAHQARCRTSISTSPRRTSPRSARRPSTCSTSPI